MSCRARIHRCTVLYWTIHSCAPVGVGVLCVVESCFMCCAVYPYRRCCMEELDDNSHEYSHRKECALYSPYSPLCWKTFPSVCLSAPCLQAKHEAHVNPDVQRGQSIQHAYFHSFKIIGGCKSQKKHEMCYNGLELFWFDVLLSLALNVAAQEEKEGKGKHQGGNSIEKENAKPDPRW